MDVVNKIADVQTDYSDRPLQDQKIKSMTVETFGEDYPDPEKCCWELSLKASPGRAAALCTRDGNMTVKQQYIMKQQYDNEAVIW